MPDTISGVFTYLIESLNLNYEVATFILCFNFTILYWFCHISKWICHRYACVPHPEPSSVFSPHTIPLGRPSAPAPSIQYRASKLDWQLISYMILYIFQCHSPKSSHPLPKESHHVSFYSLDFIQDHLSHSIFQRSVIYLSLI